MGAGTLSAQAQTYFEPAAKRCGHADGIAEEECVAVNGYCNACTPVATLAGVLIERDWDGLVQGIETAGATAAATLILKYAVCEAPSGWFRYAFVPVGTFGCEFCDCCISSTALWLGIRLRHMLLPLM